MECSGPCVKRISTSRYPSPRRKHKVSEWVYDSDHALKIQVIRYGVLRMYVHVLKITLQLPIISLR